MKNILTLIFALMAGVLAIIAQPAKNGKMGVYQFHGMGAEFFKITRETHRDFLAFLREHSDEYPVVTFSEAVAAMLSK